MGRGERIGLVRFGSRVDMWVPRGTEILVKVGDNVKGGSSILARAPLAAAGVRSPSQPSQVPDENLTGAGKRNS